MRRSSSTIAGALVLLAAPALQAQGNSAGARDSIPARHLLHTDDRDCGGAFFAGAGLAAPFDRRITDRTRARWLQQDGGLRHVADAVDFDVGSPGAIVVSGGVYIAGLLAHDRPLASRQGSISEEAGGSRRLLATTELLQGDCGGGPAQASGRRTPGTGGSVAVCPAMATRPSHQARRLSHSPSPPRRRSMPPGHGHTIVRCGPSFSIRRPARRRGPRVSGSEHWAKSRRRSRRRRAGTLGGLLATPGSTFCTPAIRSAGGSCPAGDASARMDRPRTSMAHVPDGPYHPSRRTDNYGCHARKRMLPTRYY